MELGMKDEVEFSMIITADESTLYILRHIA
jgi:hypothetical protein